MSKFPRIDLPGVDREQVDRVRAILDEAEAFAADVQRNREGMVAAMLRTGYRPYLGHVYRRPKPTRHQRLKARLALRSRKATA